MKNITIFEPGETVYYLSSDGFKRGKIKSVILNQTNLALSYRIIATDHHDIYMGDERPHNQVWRVYDDMLEYFNCLSL